MQCITNYQGWGILREFYQPKIYFTNQQDATVKDSHDKIVHGCANNYYYYNIFP